LSFILAILVVLLSAQPVFIVEAAPEMRVIDFENGTRQGFEGHGGVETLTVTSDEAYSGTRSLFVTDRSQSWHGPSLNVTFYAEPDVLYTVTAWVLPLSGSSDFRLSTQIGEGDGAEYYNLDVKTVSTSDGWTELQGRFIYPNAEYITIYIENDTPDAEFYIDDISFFAPSGGGMLASIQLPSLHEIYKDHFLIGSAFSRQDLTGQRFELVQRHFNAMTAGNAMKPDALGGKSKGDYQFSSADSFIETLAGAGIPVHGHTLVWHAQSAPWLNKNPDGTVLTRDEARANLEEFINTVAGHYAGRVISWDVVNEAFTASTGSVPSDWRDALRKGGSSAESAAWYGAYANGADMAAGESGADYIYDAFVFTRLADPNAILYFNDYNEEYMGKREAIALMAEDLNEKWKADPRNTEPDRLLVEGLGMQAHYWTDALNPQDVEDTIRRWIRTGAEISVSELDIPAGSWSRYKELDEAEEMKQATLYAQLFKIYKDYSDHIARVSIWGIDDPTSWRSAGSPLLFNETGGPKLAFYAVMDPEGFLAGDYNDIKNQTGGESTGVPASPPDKGVEPSPSSEATPSPSQNGGEEESGAIFAVDGVLILIIVGSVAVLAAIVALVIVLMKRKR
jgi:endo-1,4-beta-xylanase